jgi:hypothetical protein
VAERDGTTVDHALEDRLVRWAAEYRDAGRQLEAEFGQGTVSLVAFERRMRATVQLSQCFAELGWEPSSEVAESIRRLHLALGDQPPETP